MSVSPEARAKRRDEIERVLARYPHLSTEAVVELSDYFAHEASALDVGLIASNEAVAAPYRLFRDRHLDPLRPRDWLRGALWALVFAAGLVALLLHGL